MENRQNLINVLQPNIVRGINPLNADLIPICHLLALLGAHPILHISRIRVKGSLRCFQNF